MKVIHFGEAETYEPEKDWKRASLCNQADISIEHFVKPPRHSSPRHEHPSAQVLVVLEGSIAVESGGRREVIGKGDAVYLPGGEEHVVTNESDATSSGLDIFVPGRSFDFWLKREKS